MARDVSANHLTNNVVRLVTVTDVRLKILEAAGLDAIDFESARRADAETARASAAELRATFERLDVLMDAKSQ